MNTCKFTLCPKARSAMAKMLILAGAMFMLATPAHASLMFEVQIRSLDLVGVGANSSGSMHLTAGQASTGNATVAPDGTPGDINPGNSTPTVTDSFFDIFTELEICNGSNCNQQPVEQRIKTSAPCETFGFLPFPPDCPYVGEPVSPITVLGAAILKFLLTLGPPQELLPPMPGWDHALVMAAVLDIDTDPVFDPKLRLVGEMIVDLRQVPEPETALLLLLAAAAATFAGRHRAARVD